MIGTGFKHVGFLTRKPDQSVEQFQSHWHDVHSELARRIPGLRGYVLNPIDRTRYPQAPVDGFSELWFDSEEAAAEAFETPEGKACFEDVENFIGTLTIANIHETRVA
jgi:uncharacterized protein (TIGR02118 family)